MYYGDQQVTQKLEDDTPVQVTCPVVGQRLNQAYFLPNLMTGFPDSCSNPLVVTPHLSHLGDCDCDCDVKGDCDRDVKV